MGFCNSPTSTNPVIYRKGNKGVIRWFCILGRYVATAVSWWGHKVDNAFWLWNFQGKLLYKQPMEKFCQLLWRPRTPSLLSKDKVKVTFLRLTINYSFIPRYWFWHCRAATTSALVNGITEERIS